MASKAAIYIYARSIAAYYKGVQADGKVRDWELLKDIYEVMEPKPNWETLPQGSNLEAIKNGRWLRKDGVPGGTPVESLGTAWCGIFAAYVLKGVGLPVKWKALQGIAPLDPFLEMCSYAKANEIEPGDICVRGTNQHHFIVYDKQGDKLLSYDGNLPGQSIAERSYDIADTVKAAREADINMAQKRKELSAADFQKYVRSTSKYNFYFYRLKKA